MSETDLLLRHALLRHQAGDFDAAIDGYRAVLDKQAGRMDVRHWLGLALSGAGRNAEAAAWLGELASDAPADPNYLHDWAAALWANNEPGPAEKAFEQSLEVEPDFVKSLLNLGALLAEQWRYDDALPLLERADQLRPNDLKTGYRLGRVLNAIGQMDRAVELYRTLLAQHLDDPELHYDLAMALLRGGNLAEGFAEFEWRFKRPGLGVSRLKPPCPPWQGDSLDGREILIWREQGLGDELYFAGLYQDVIKAARRTVIDCDPRLGPLLARSFPEADIVPRHEKADPRLVDSRLDVHCAAGTLPRWLRRSVDAFPDPNRFLVADPKQVDAWRKRLQALGPGPWIGISWRSGLTTGTRSQHYTALTDWGPIFGLADAGFVNLQYDRCEAELAAAQNQWNRPIAHFSDLDLRDDLDGVAALMAALDGVIAPPNAVAAMAGALSLPTWMMTVPDIIPDNWAYLGTTGLPWLPSVRVVRQRHHGKWAPAVQETADALRQYFGLV